MLRDGGRLSTRGSRGRAVSDVRREGQLHYGDKLAFMIHGYNVNPGAADRSYTAFFKHAENMMSVFRESVPIHHTAYRFYWPGSTAYGESDNSRVDQISAPLYASALARAKDSANRLANYLLDLSRQPGPAIEVSFVAHSMGCRVALEAVSLVWQTSPQQGRLKLSIVMLMAAAVPVSGVNSAIASLRPRAGRSFIGVLYSRGDFILRNCFPIGQWWARQRRIESLTGEALGLNGSDGNMADYRVPMRSSKNINEAAGHSDYWDNKLSSAELALLSGLDRERRINRYVYEDLPNWRWSFGIHQLKNHDMPRW